MLNQQPIESKNGKALVLIIIITIIIAGGAFTYWKFVAQENPATNTNPNIETENWKSFNDPKIGYAFKYPQDWELTTRTGGHYIFKSINGENYAKVLTQFATWENFESANGKITFEDYVKKIKNEHLADKNVKNFKEEKISLAGKEAIKFSYEVPDRTLPAIPGVSEGGVKLGELDTEIYVKTDKGLFYLVGSAVREKETNYPIANQILSTFTF